MSLLGAAKMYARFAFGLRRFLRNPVDTDEARHIVLKAMAEREINFLRVLQRGVFGYPSSPYLPLFRHAGCQFGDVQSMVRGDGLESTLLALRKEGVYLSFEECKGRVPIVRHGKVFPVNAHDFDNPYSQRHYTARSGGSTGAGTRVHHDLDYLAERAARMLLGYKAHGVAHLPTAVWRGVLPDGSGINVTLSMSRIGNPPRKWFTPVSSEQLELSLIRFRIATQLTVFLGRCFGVRLAWPENVPPDRAIEVARWAHATIQKHGACLVDTVASRALRVCVAARDAGLDLTGATFIVAGEPVSPAKVRGIHAAGARHFSTYGFSEAGRIGMGCANPTSGNDLHLISDTAAIIAFPRLVPGTTLEVPAFNVTTLLPSSPKILINAESDDYGIIEQRSCGCPLDNLGWSTHLHEVRSFRKLTGEGVTLLGSEMLHILEEVLPARFGGTMLDYQIAEEEDAKGFTKLSLIISPSVALPDDATVVEFFLQALGRESIGAGNAGLTMAKGGVIQVKRMQPVLTGRGKLMPLVPRK
jgi:phenylacetate-coenzyme A ligase PaaK-like adenylate-forming protein